MRFSLPLTKVQVFRLRRESSLGSRLRFRKECLVKFLCETEVQEFLGLVINRTGCARPQSAIIDYRPNSVIVIHNYIHD